MQLRLFIIAFSFTLLTAPGCYSAEVPSTDLLWDPAFIRFSYNESSPAVLIRIPFTETRFRIQTREELRAPLGRYTDMKIPLSYHFTNKVLMHLTGTMERMYLMQSPREMLNSTGWGVPLGTMYGSAQTEQVVIEFGFSMGF